MMKVMRIRRVMSPFDVDDAPAACFSTKASLPAAAIMTALAHEILFVASPDRDDGDDAGRAASLRLGRMTAKAYFYRQEI